MEAFYAAYNADDFDKLPQFATEDWTHIAPNGIVRKGRADVLQALRQTHSTFLKGVTNTPEEITVRLVTPDAAVVTVRTGARRSPHRTASFTRTKPGSGRSSWSNAMVAG